MGSGRDFGQIQLRQEEDAVIALSFDIVKVFKSDMHYSGSAHLSYVRI
ncbi:MAG: hypothetical protein LAO21_23085 [Acidobacteriia bacterium]|nr:hypothetical protein [Terriglobia bacterium]